MLIKFFLKLTSYFFIIVKFIKKDLLKRGNFETLPGYILEKIPFNLTSYFFNHFKKSDFIFITGTNGKTSSCSLLSHILKNNGYFVVSNNSGSNLKRGILSTFILNFNKKDIDYFIFEVDEASSSVILKDFPDSKEFTLVVLNLSRDQLDRYGEIDTLIKNLNNTLSTKNYKLVLGKNSRFSEFKKPNFVVRKNHKKHEEYKEILNITSNHISENLNIILYVLSLNSLKTKTKKVPYFSLVEGRGTQKYYKNTKLEIHLTKNPASFSANLNLLLNSKYKNIFIMMNDNIPDGRDVSWFYDVDYQLLQKSLQDKSIFVGGTRSYDFYNLLNTLNIPNFNALNFKSALNYCAKFNMEEVFVFSNYSATQDILRCRKLVGKNI